MWFYHNKVFTLEDIEPDVIGFVYIITNLENGRMYIGKKKLFRSYKTRATKKKRSRRMKAVSDWNDYYGSCTELLEDVNRLGKETFRRDILYLCKSLGEMSYLEALEQINHQVLLRNDFYNNFIGCRIHRKHLKSLAL